MAEEEPTYSVDVKIQRGNGTDDRDTLKATVQEDTLYELDERKQEMLERLEVAAHGSPPSGRSESGSTDRVFPLGVYALRPVSRSWLTAPSRVVLSTVTEPPDV